MGVRLPTAEWGVAKVMRMSLAGLIAAALVGLMQVPAGAAGTPGGNGLTSESVDCPGGVSGEAVRSYGLAVWMDGEQWLVTSFSSPSVSWSNRASGAARNATPVTCTDGDAVITLVQLERG
jgi:hypothetical protein